jgi:invasion protein IalB
MVFSGLVKTVALTVTAMLALSLGPAGAMAQGKGNKAPAPAAGQQHQQQQAAGEQKKPDIWYKICIDVPTPEPTKPGEQPKPQKPEEMKKTNICLTQADVRDNVTAMLVGRLAVRQVAGQPQPQMVVMLPLQTALQAGALVKLDDKEPVKFAYSTCDRAGCYAEGVMEPAMLDQMKSGKQIAYLGMGINGRALSIPLPLEGFAKAIDGQPMSLDKYNEEQRKIAQIIQARLAELRKKQEEAEAAQGGQSTQPAAPAQPPAAPPAKKK